MFRLLLNIIIGFLLIHKISCGTEKENFSTPSQYDLAHPVTIRLPEVLNKISGIGYYPKDTALFAVSEESGWLYKIKIKNNIFISTWKLSASRNFKDVVLLDSSFYVLNKKGSVVKFKFRNNYFASQEFPFLNRVSKNYGSMYYDVRSNLLRILSEHTEFQNKRFHFTGISFDPMSGKISDTVYSSVKTSGLADTCLSHFIPSAAAINPLTNQLFILSSSNKILAIADPDGIIKKCFHLPSAIYNNPEGICFTPRGDMIISNESYKTQPANLLIFKLANNQQ